MKNLSIAFLAAMSLASFGCKKKGGDTGTYTADMDKFAADMCACKDMACSKSVSEKMAKWSTDAGATAGAAKVSEADSAKIAEAGKKLADCQTKLMTAEAGSAMADSAVGSAAAAAADSVATAAGSAAVAAGSAGSAAADAAGSAVTAAVGSAATAAASATAASADLPKECADFKAAAEKYATCDKVPQAQRDTMAAGFKTQSEGWSKLSGMDADSKATLVKGCVDALANLKTGAQAQGCTL